MRKSWFLLLIILLSHGPVMAQQKKVAVFLVHAGAAGSTEEKVAIQREVRTIFSYYFGISESHTEIGFDSPPAGVSVETLGEAATNFDLDTVILATLPDQRSNAAAVPVVVYDSSASKTTYSNTLTVDFGADGRSSVHHFFEPVIDELLNVSAVWGTVEAVPRGAEGSFSLTIDGVEAGDNVRKPLWVPPGKHIVVARQMRPFGNQILLEKEVEIVQGTRQSVNFAIPDLTDLEQTAFEEINNRILDAWEDDGEEVGNQFDLLSRLFEGIDAGGALARYKTKYETWNQDYLAGREASKIVIDTGPDEDTRERIAAEIELAPDNGLIEERPVGGSSFGSVLLASTGPLLQRLGGLTLGMAHESMYVREDGSPIYPSYSNLSLSLKTANEVFYWSTLGLWGGGGIFESLLYPYGSYRLSPWGKALYSSAVLLDVAGNVLSQLAHVIRAEYAIVDFDYDKADFDAHDLGRERDELYDLYALARLGSYGAWGLGTIASVTAPLIGGPRMVAVSGVGQKILHTTGTVLKVIGNLSSLVSYNSRMAATEYEEEYVDLTDFSSAESAETYERYELYYTIYAVSSLLSYGAWGLGAVSLILAAILPEVGSGGDAPRETRPTPLFTVEPRNGGVFTGLRMAL